MRRDHLRQAFADQQPLKLVLHRGGAGDAFRGRLTAPRRQRFHEDPPLQDDGLGVQRRALLDLTDGPLGRLRIFLSQQNPCFDESPRIFVTRGKSGRRQIFAIVIERLGQLGWLQIDVAIGQQDVDRGTVPRLLFERLLQNRDAAGIAARVM